MSVTVVEKWPIIKAFQQCKVEEKVDNDKDIKIAHKPHHAGKNIIVSMIAIKSTNKDSKVYLTSEKKMT